MSSYLLFSQTFPTYKEFLFVFFILCRVSGIFLVSPLLSNKAVTGTVRLYLSFFIAIILALVLYPDYLGDHPRFQLSSLPSQELPFIFIIAGEGIKELVIGYLLGFMFNIIFEALMWAGELIDTMIGLSTGQFYDPISNTFHSLSGKLLMLFGALFMLIVDLHHVIIRLLAQSFSIIPLGNFEMNAAVIANVNSGFSLLFIYAIKFGAIPMVTLACSLVGIAFTVRIIPEMNVILTGLPMRVLIGIYIFIIALSHIPPVIVHLFHQIFDLTGNIVDSLAQME